MWSSAYGALLGLLDSSTPAYNHGMKQRVAARKLAWAPRPYRNAAHKICSSRAGGKGLPEVTYVELTELGCMAICVTSNLTSVRLLNMATQPTTKSKHHTSSIVKTSSEGGAPPDSMASQSRSMSGYQAMIALITTYKGHRA